MEIKQKGLNNCPNCDNQLMIRISRSEKNPGRKYYKCTDFSCKDFIGFVDQFDDIKIYQLPRMIKANNIISGDYEVTNNQIPSTSFFQCMGTIPQIVNKFSYAETFQTQVRSMSQWRLDFYKHKNLKINKKMEGVISQALNIMNRGTLTYATPRVKNILENLKTKNSS